MIPCDTIGAAVAGYLDVGDFTPARTTYARVLTGMAREFGPQRPVVELDAGGLAVGRGDTAGKLGGESSGPEGRRRPAVVRKR